MAGAVERVEDRSVVRAGSADDAVRKLTEGDGPGWRLKYAFERTKLPEGSPAPSDAVALSGTATASKRKEWSLPALDLPVRTYDAAMRRSAFLGLGLAAATLGLFAFAHDAIDRPEPAQGWASGLYALAVVTGAGAAVWGAKAGLGRAWGIPLLVLGAALLAPWALEADLSYATSEHCDGAAAANANWMGPLVYGSAAMLVAGAAMAALGLRSAATTPAAARTASVAGVVGGALGAGLAGAAAWQLWDLSRAAATSRAAWYGWESRDPLACATTHWIPTLHPVVLVAAVVVALLVVQRRRPLP